MATSDARRRTLLQLWRVSPMKASFTLGQITLGMVVAAAIAAGAGYALANRNVPTSSAVSTAINSKGDRQVLYWYDPMVPTQHFDKPGKSPFMDMELVPKRSEEHTSELQSLMRISYAV